MQMFPVPACHQGPRPRPPPSSLRRHGGGPRDEGAQSDLGPLRATPTRVTWPQGGLGVPAPSCWSLGGGSFTSFPHDTSPGPILWLLPVANGHASNPKVCRDRLGLSICPPLSPRGPGARGRHRESGRHPRPPHGAAIPGKLRAGLSPCPGFLAHGSRPWAGPPSLPLSQSPGGPLSRALACGALRTEPPE